MWVSLVVFLGAVAYIVIVGRRHPGREAPGDAARATGGRRARRDEDDRDADARGTTAADADDAEPAEATSGRGRRQPQPIRRSPATSYAPRMRRAKIVCTLGPATSDPEMIRALVVAGMDVARLNLSHGTKAEHERAYAAVRAAADATGRSVAVLVDLQGPKIRLGSFADRPGPAGRRRPVHDHDRGRAWRPPRICSTTYQYLADDVEPGDRILVDDGKVVLEVDAASSAGPSRPPSRSAAR